MNEIEFRDLGDHSFKRNFENISEPRIDGALATNELEYIYIFRENSIVLI